MNEPQFIRSNAPHEVSMPEGSHIAAGKTVGVGGVTVHKVLNEEENFDSYVLGTEAVKPILPIESKDLNTIPLKSKDEDSGNRTLEDKSSEKNLISKFEEEMNFPARLIYLKIENKRVKEELNILEQKMNSGI